MIQLLLRLFIVFGLMLLSSCGSDRADSEKIVQIIEDGIMKKGYNNTVECPSNITWKTGQDFHCIAHLASVGDKMVTVHMENDNGDIIWEMEP